MVPYQYVELDCRVGNILRQNVVDSDALVKI